jgi:hypothetical protein
MFHVHATPVLEVGINHEMTPPFPPLGPVPAAPGIWQRCRHNSVTCQQHPCPILRVEHTSVYATASAKNSSIGGLARIAMYSKKTMYADWDGMTSAYFFYHAYVVTPFDHPKQLYGEQLERGGALVSCLFGASGAVGRVSQTLAATTGSCGWLRSEPSEHVDIP